MRLVVDTNIMFSALLNKNSSIGDIILNSQDLFTFYGCETLRDEISKHQVKILSLTNYSSSAYEEVLSLLFERISFIDESNIPLPYWQKAAAYVRDIDENDIVFVALSLFFDIKLWTGDKQLLNGLMRKGYHQLITTADLLIYRNNTPY